MSSGRQAVQATAAGRWGWRPGAALPPSVIWAPSVLVAAAMLLPLAYLLLRALDAGDEVWGLLARPRTLQILVRSLLLVATVTVASIAIAVPLAWLTVRTDLPLRRAWAVVTPLPLVVPSYVGAFLVVAVLGPKGMLQGWLAPLGVERLPDIYGLPGTTLTLALLSYPYVLLPVRSALVRLDPALEEAAWGLGAGSWRTFRRVTWPLLRPAIAAGGLLVALYTLSDFGAVSLLRYETFTWAIYLQYETFDRNAAAALSLALVLLAFGLLASEAATRGPGRYYRSGASAGRSLRRVSLGSWRWPALAFCAVVALLSLVMPVAVLLSWAARGLGEVSFLELLGKPALNSVVVSLLAAGIALLAALPVAVLAVRFPTPLASMVEQAAHLVFALPHIVVALALVFFGLQFAAPIYQTRTLLIFAYAVLFFPAALGALRASLLQVSPRLEEAARGLGRSPAQVLRSITLPLLQPGVLAGGALVFLLTMKELPATLLLSPPGFVTLATVTWSAASEAFFAQAAVPALLLVLASSIIMGLVVLREAGRR